MTSEEAKAKRKGFKMIKYKNEEADTGVREYCILKDGIILKFKDPKYYLYSYVKPGKRHVQEMIKLAKKKEGLSGYTSQNVKFEYEDKWEPE
jgi:hypothetical protein